MGIEIGGIFGLLWLIAAIWAVLNIAQSARSPIAKAIWIVVVLVFPILGLVVWLLFGPRAVKA